MIKTLKFSDIKRPTQDIFHSDFHSYDLESSVKGIYYHLSASNDCYISKNTQIGHCDICYYSVLNENFNYKCLIKPQIKEYLKTEIRLNPNKEFQIGILLV